MSRTVWILGIIAVIGVAGLAFVMLEKQPTGDLSSDGLESGAAPLGDGTTAGKEGAFKHPLDSSPVKVREFEAPPPDEDQPRGARKRPLMQMSGTLVVANELGQKDDSANGSFVLTTTGSDDNPVTVDVREGQFHFEIGLTRHVRIDDLWVGGRKALLETAPGALRPGAPLKLMAFHPKATLLKVTDASTGNELDEVEVVTQEPGHEDLRMPGPGAGSRSVARGPSPIEVLPDRVRQVFYVRGRDHGWGRIELHARSGGERTIRLGIGSSLAVQVEGRPKDHELALRIYPEAPSATKEKKDARPRGEPLSEVSLTQDKITLDGLPSGNVEVRVEIGPWYRNPVVLAEASIALRAGETEELRLRLAGTEALGATVPVAGTLRVPGGFAKERFTLTLQADPPNPLQEKVSIAKDRMTEDDPETFHWDAGNMIPGTYVAAILGHFFPVTVTKGGSKDLRLELPEPSELLVFVNEAGNGTRIKNALVLCHAPTPGQIATSSRAVARIDPESGGQLFLVAPGQAMVKVRAPGYLPESRPITLKRGRNELSFELKRQQGIRVRLFHDHRPVPMGSGVRVDIRALGVEGQRAGGSLTHDGMSLTRYLSEAGSYLVRFTALPGYALPEERSVTVPRGQIVDLHLDVRPK